MGPKKSVTRFEPAERDENIHKPQPTEFVSNLYISFIAIQTWLIFNPIHNMTHNLRHVLW